MRSDFRETLRDSGSKPSMVSDGQTWKCEDSLRVGEEKPNVPRISRISWIGEDRIMAGQNHGNGIRNSEAEDYRQNLGPDLAVSLG